MARIAAAPVEDIAALVGPALAADISKALRDRHPEISLHNGINDAETVGAGEGCADGAGEHSDGEGCAGTAGESATAGEHSAGGSFDGSSGENSADGAGGRNESGNMSKPRKTKE